MSIWSALASNEPDEIEEGQESEISFGMNSGGGGRKRVGLAMIVPRFQIWVERGIEPNEHGIVPPSERRDFERGSFMYWPVTQIAHAQAMQKIVRPDSRYDPAQVVLIDMQASSFLNWPADAAEPKNILTNVEVARSYPTLMPAKNDAEEKRRWRQVAFHHMFLPSLVQSVAVAAGLMPKQVYDYGNDSVVMLEEANEEVFQAMIGSKDEPGELVSARAAIWAALGEDKPNKWSADTAGRVTNVAPGSGLHRIIRHMLYRVTAEPLWCEIAPYTIIPDPHAVDKNGKAQLAPIITRAWQTEAEAKTYAQTVYPNSSGQAGVSSLPLPREFRVANIAESAFLAHVKGLLAKPTFVGKSSADIRMWLSTANGQKWITSEGLESPEAIWPWIEKAMS